MNKTLEKMDYEDIERYKKILPHLEKIEKEKKRYINDLIEGLISLNFAKNEDEAKNLIKELSETGLIAFGLDENFKETWHTTAMPISHLELLVKLKHLNKKKKGK